MLEANYEASSVKNVFSLKWPFIWTSKRKIPRKSEIVCNCISSQTYSEPQLGVALTLVEVNKGDLFRGHLKTGLKSLLYVFPLRLGVFESLQNKNCTRW